MYKIGIDLGGTKTEAVLIDENSEVIERKRVPTPQNDYNSIVQSIIDLISKLKTTDSKLEYLPNH